MHCISHDGTGGESTMVDGFYVGRLLKESHPEHYETLLNTPVLAHWINDELNYQSYHTVLRHHIFSNKLTQIR